MHVLAFHTDSKWKLQLKKKQGREEIYRSPSAASGVPSAEPWGRLEMAPASPPPPRMSDMGKVICRTQPRGKCQCKTPHRQALGSFTPRLSEKQHRPRTDTQELSTDAPWYRLQAADAPTAYAAKWLSVIYMCIEEVDGCCNNFEYRTLCISKI